MERLPDATSVSSGFRLQQLEVFNWGTFDQHVWRLQPGGESILLTGDIGSGKSTLVDALGTLLVPPHKLSYNKAAGADAHERSLRSYVLGHYKSERGEMGARAVALRDHNSYSVLLAVFANEALDETVTLAQVFWMKNPRGEPERFYVAATSALSVTTHFAGFGSDIGQLRKRLRTLDSVQLHDTFLPYGAELRRRFGIPGEQALDLFHQTVSVKSVGDLTGFVREHMLEPFPVQARVAALIAGFEDLNRAHDAVLKSKAQVEMLTSMVADLDRYSDLAAQAISWRRCRTALRPWFAQRRRALIEERIAALQADAETAAATVAALDETWRQQRQQQDALTEAIATNGGNRIGQLGAEIARLEIVKDERAARAARYAQQAKALGLPEAPGAATFASNRRAIEDGQAKAKELRDDAAMRLTEAGVLVRELGRQHGELSAELESLRKRSTNVPRRLVALRAALCEAIGVAHDTLPFCGELVRVREEEHAWAGAAERVLAAFAQSLLIPDVHYPAAQAWVAGRDLGASFRLCRARASSSLAPGLFVPRSLINKIEVRPDSPFRNWLLAELAQHFDYVCCERADQLQREKAAVTRDGLVKRLGEHYEKDDTFAIGERAHWVLGWSNEAKVAALTKRERDVSARIQAHVAQVSALKRAVDEQDELIGFWKQLAACISFKELDWKASASMIEQLERERRELSAATDILGTLRQQMDLLADEQDATRVNLEAALREQGRLAGQLEHAKCMLEQCEVSECDGEPMHFTELAVLEQTLGASPLTLESAVQFEHELRDLVQVRIEESEHELLPLRDTILGATQRYVQAWPLDTREVDISIEGAREFRQILETLRSSELPRLEQRYTELLGDSMVRDIAGFDGQLQRECQTVRERIDLINGSLRNIDYNPGRYLRLEAAPNLDADLRDFQQELRACIADMPAGEGLDVKFQQLRRIVERFRGREGTLEMDQRWTRKVTDVRNWFVFSASERWREGDDEYEHYADAAGKSGGQKEKLAYTVLAAALAAQFGLSRGDEPKRTFRFAVIDEAFGRGSDDSARYGLELFRRLGLQLLVVTPLQKIHIIEPYVAGLGFVHSESGQRSMLRYLGMDAYQAERSERQAAS